MAKRICINTFVVLTIRKLNTKNRREPYHTNVLDIKTTIKPLKVCGIF